MNNLFSASEGFVKEYMDVAPIQDVVYVQYETMVMSTMCPLGKIYPTKQAVSKFALEGEDTYNFKDTLPVLAMCSLLKNKDIPNMVLEFLASLEKEKKKKMVFTKDSFFVYIALRYVARVNGKFTNLLSAVLMRLYALAKKEQAYLFKAVLKNKY